MAVRKAKASAVIEVSVPQTVGLSSVGKTRRTDRCLVGRRTARWNQLPHLWSLTV